MNWLCTLNYFQKCAQCKTPLWQILKIRQCGPFPGNDLICTWRSATWSQVYLMYGPLLCFLFQNTTQKFLYREHWVSQEDKTYTYLGEVCQNFSNRGIWTATYSIGADLNEYLSLNLYTRFQTLRPSQDNVKGLILKCNLKKTQKWKPNIFVCCGIQTDKDRPRTTLLYARGTAIQHSTATQYLYSPLRIQGLI